MVISDAIATLLVGALGLIQWWLSERARSRQRDVEMLRWGGEVIELMSELETVCEYGKPPDPGQAQLMAAVTRASALLDQGRLFFPDAQSEDRDDLDEEDGDPVDRGFRLKILDEVTRAYLMAKHLMASYAPPDPALKRKMRAARRRFVALLQSEMGPSQRKSSTEKTGRAVPRDPLKWSEAR